MLNISALDLNVEFHKAIEQRCFPEQAGVNRLGWRPSFGSRFQEPEPDQGSENASLHRTGTEIPLRFQNADYGSCAEPGQCLSRQPIIRRCRKRPQNDAHLALGPRIDRVSIEIGEVQVPERDVEKKRLQGTVLLRREDSPSQRRHDQLPTMRPEELRGLREDAKCSGRKSGSFMTLEYRNSSSLS